MVQQSLDATNCDCCSEGGDAPSSCNAGQDGEPDLCALCLDRIQIPEKLHCNHAFCKSCLSLYREARNWVAKRCPICRRRLDMEDQVSRRLHDDWRLLGFMMLPLMLLSLGPFYLLLLYW
ncbi:E3 ubiquitin-protein ligase RNF125 [Drosophila teissieri]|uniref:E3 ubiquitin-protein ligase RNF125 n=1 Tax=Drosophila teissieri TaxID=7243 RepID=UPI001CBA2BCE|nr:E3 ubiquitin-protein ligase RNF125 [Drosophila teissieri]